MFDFLSDLLSISHIQNYSFAREINSRLNDRNFYLRSESSSGNSVQKWIISKTHIPTHKMSLLSPSLFSLSFIFTYENYIENCTVSGVNAWVFYGRHSTLRTQHLINLFKCVSVFLFRVCYQSSTNIYGFVEKWEWTRQPHMLMIIILLIDFA